jgi:hypothetical protein
MAWQGAISAAAGSATLTPLTAAAGCILWLEADRGVTLNGSNVSALDDQSTSNYDLSQGVAASQNLWESTSVNGLPGIQGATGDWLENTGVLQASGDFTLIFCFDAVTINTSSTHYIYWNTNSSSGIFTSGTAVSNKAGYFDGTSTLIVPNAISTGRTIITLIQSGTTLTIRYNGPTNSATGTRTAQAIRNVQILNRSALDAFSDSELAGMSGYNSALSGASLTAAESTYWATKYSVTLA